ncbi:MAG TPA: putative inorganic carbon transporter subunit DabA, partial [Paracoccaceae bacterium]|nr:putative inorganic carbon transporter subunit DabA [Paracoccaceae bacterium]
MAIEAGVDMSIIRGAAERAARHIPPLWPLASYVAVNPFLGQTSETLPEAGARLARVGGVAATMPRQWYLDRLARGQISHGDLAAALAACPHPQKPRDVEALKAAAAKPRREPCALPTVADLAAETSGTDWPGLMADRIGAWAAGYFDAGQAL